ncbi:zinc finger protein 90-like [Anopheles maculipalpis]|uniref:zinc finger protein 90-like n=1 Tax=Anopheles maculipalpis TaxID=1496333 RepID=UPI00215909A4|nr:zinc finger protein 90-like [Anopheles maculipalpis]
MDHKPVYCLLCFKSENPAKAISCEEQPKAVTILCRQFWFTSEEIEQKCVCSVCWTYVDEFNNFYEQIKLIHDAEEQEQMALQEDSMHIACGVDRIDTEMLIEEESSLLSETLGVDECHDADPLINQIKVETITIESIDAVNSVKDESKEINVEQENHFGGNFQEQNLPKTRQNSCTLERIKCHTLGNTTEQATDENTNSAFLFTHQQDNRRKQNVASAEPNVCTDCGKLYPTEQSLEQHRKRDHRPGLMCDICSKWLKTPESLRKHQQNSHHPERTDRVECSICKKWMKNTGSLKKHMIRHETSDKPNICDICGKVSPNYSALRSHKLFVHEMQRTFSCLICKKAFKRAFTLEEHMTTHTGSSLYNCPHCTRTFNSSANLHAHRKKMHRKEWEISRNEYEKRFRGEQ